MPNRLIQFEIFFRRHRFRADFSKALQIFRVFAIDNDRRVTGSLVNNVRRRCVFDVMDLAHVARDNQHLVSLEFHERRRRNKAVHGHRAPANLRQNIVHLLNARYAIKRDAGVKQALEINFVRVLLQEKNILAHDKSPDCVID